MPTMHRQHLPSRASDNPYSVQPGFTKRVSYAVEALHRLASDPRSRAPVQARSFDNCFAMWDGNAVIWELVNRVREGDELLAQGIAGLGPAVWIDWLNIYQSRTRIEAFTQPRFEGLMQLSDKPVIQW
jgi:hypothetical protein